jgi:hypothetical protein
VALFRTRTAGAEKDIAAQQARVATIRHQQQKAKEAYYHDVRGAAFLPEPAVGVGCGGGGAGCAEFGGFVVAAGSGSRGVVGAGGDEVAVQVGQLEDGVAGLVERRGEAAVRAGDIAAPGCGAG